jgi:hypothetical protein
MTKQDPASTYTTAKFMSELSGIPMNYEKYPTLNSMLFYQTQTTKRKVIFPAAYIKVVTESGDIVEYYSENSRFDQKGIVAKEFIVTRQRALVDFNVEFAVVGIKTAKEGLVLYGTALQN